MQPDLTHSFLKIDAAQPGLCELLYHAPDAIFIESLEGYVLQANLQACKLHGLTHEQLIGKHVLQLVPQQEREKVAREFPKLASGDIQRFEGYSLHQSGKSIPVELMASQITYMNQPALLIHVRDISTRKALHQCDLLNEAILQALPGGVIRLDAQKRIILANAQAIDFFCLQQDKDSDFYEFCDHCELMLEDGSVVDLKTHWPGYLCMKQLQRQKEITLGYKCSNEQNATRWGVFSAIPIIDSQTQICQGAVVTFVDNTALRNTLVALRESEHLFHRAFDHAPMGMVLATPQGQFTQINSRFCDMLGYPKSEMIKLSFTQIAHPDDHAQCQAAIQQLHRNPAISQTLRKRYVHAKGHDVWCQLTVMMIRDDKGIPQYCLSQIEDLTPQIKAQDQQEELEQRLRQAHKLQAVGTLASGVAHDFNNLLLAIESYLDMAQTQLQRGQDPTYALQNIRQAIGQSTGMTRSLLTFAHQTTCDKQPVDLASLVKQSLQTLKPLIPKSITVQVINNIQEKLLLEADVSQIQQLLMNLIVNARDAMPKEGTLTLTTESQSCPNHPPLLILRVTDNGIGMNPQTQERIFEPFFTTKSRGQGTGLGLAVVHGIVTDHHAQIEVFSKPNQGTQFKITFPALVQTPEPST